MKIDTQQKRSCCGAQGHLGACSGGGCGSCNGKLTTYDYLSMIPPDCGIEDYVEVQFKNTRKGFYLNDQHLPLYQGDMVAVEASPGHDIGTVTLTGKMVELQMRRCHYKVGNDNEPKRIFRTATPSDMEKYLESKAKEDDTMIQSRVIAKELELDMKIGDVEYQGDGQKAIFYYIADQRVDFRQLIKRLAEAFRIRIEMKQIGARQEAGRIGGLGPCGRQLCCSGWISSFVSVGTNAARIQDLSLNPQKLAGQCAKLKCCLNYEVDSYFEAQQKLPSREIELETEVGKYRYFKADLLAGVITYALRGAKNSVDEMVSIPTARAFEIIRMNKAGTKPYNLLYDSEAQNKSEHNYERQSKDILSDGSLTRFDTPSKQGGSKKRRKGKEKEGRSACTPDYLSMKSNSPDAQEPKAPTPQPNERTRTQDHQGKAEAPKRMAQREHAKTSAQRRESGGNRPATPPDTKPSAGGGVAESNSIHNASVTSAKGGATSGPKRRKNGQKRKPALIGAQTTEGNSQARGRSTGTKGV